MHTCGNKITKKKHRKSIRHLNAVYDLVRLSLLLKHIHLAGEVKHRYNSTRNHMYIHSPTDINNFNQMNWQGNFKIESKLLSISVQK